MSGVDLSGINGGGSMIGPLLRIIHDTDPREVVGRVIAELHQDIKILLEKREQRSLADAIELRRTQERLRAAESQHLQRRAGVLADLEGVLAVHHESDDPAVRLFAQRAIGKLRQSEDEVRRLRQRQNNSSVG